MSERLLELETLNRSASAGMGREARLVTVTIVHHPEAARVGERAQLPLLDHLRGRVAIARGEPLFRGAQATPLLSPFVSRKPLWLEGLGDGAVRIDASECGSRVEIDGMSLGGAKDIDCARSEDGVVVLLGTHVVLLLQREPEVEPPRRDTSDLGLVGDSEGIRSVRERVARVAEDDAAVLVRGETGSGKELVAAAIHRASRRRAGPFVAVNMAAVPPTLAASELFGHARGAFSGAERAHDGYFARAHGGTLFLDEVADTPPDVQVALLRALETGEVHAVGGHGPRRVDVRIVAATDGDLEAAVAEGRFRAPLYYRLAASELRVPPLRERRADIGRLVVHFLAGELAELGREALLAPALTDEAPWLPAALLARLARYDWPGNVRQLKNVCHAFALASARPGPLTIEARELDRLMPMSQRVAPSASAERASPAPRAPSDITPEEVEAVLLALDYRLGAAAEHFGISRPSMNELIDKHPRMRRAQKLEAAEIEAALAEAARSGKPAWRLLEVSERGLQRRMKELGLA